MRITSLFAFTLVSISLLTQSYHYAGAIGIDSSSHGLLRGGRVVRRYGANGGRFRGLQERTVPNVPKAKTKGTAKNRLTKTPDEDIKGPNTAPTASAQAPPAQAPPAQAPAQTSPAPATSPTTSPTSKQTKAKGKGNVQPGQDDTTDTTLPPPNNQQDPQDPQGPQDQQDQNGSAGTPTVATGGISPQAVGGLASVGGVFVLVGGLFAFSQRRKNKEITKSIVSNSSKAWEQQNSAYETLEEEPKPIGSYTVIATYTPTLADELDIQPGDKVTILVEYDDGWVQGINETRGGVKGVFPRHCVDMNNGTNKPKNINRSSSMGGFTPERYTEVDLS